MALIEARIPYEFLARWDDQGKLAGAHVGFRTVITRDGVIVSTQATPPQPVAIGAGAGFPLADLMTTVQASALASAEAAEAARAAAVAESTRVLAERDATLASLRQQVAAHLATIEARDAAIASLQQQIEQLQAAPVVATVTRRQAVQALIRAGLDDDVDAAINAIEDPVQRKLMRSWYQDSNTFERNRPELIALGTQLGLTSTHLDELFALARTL
jgi:hypothetical protein